MFAGSREREGSHQLWKPSPRGRRADRQRARVLCVDDNTALLKSLQQVFQQAGWHAETVTQGSTALQIVRSSSFGLVVVDLKLPDMSGVQLVRELRVVGHSRPVILYTAFPDHRSAIEATELGVQYLDKAEVSVVELVRHARNALIRASIDPVVPRLSLDPAIDQCLFLLRTATAVAGDWRRLCSAPIVAAVCEIGLPLAPFSAGADALKKLFDPGSTPTLVADFFRVAHPSWIRRETLSSTIDFDRIAEAIGRQGGRWRTLSLETVGKLVPINPSAFAASSHQTGWSWRRFCLLSVVRSAAPIIALTDEQIGQIAFQLNYDHPTVFDRDFRAVLGLSPSSFRRIAQTQPNSI